MKILDLNALGLSAPELTRARGADAPHLLAEASQCAWEHVLECMHAKGTDNPTPEQDHASEVSAARDGLGSVELRHVCRELAHAISVGWALLDEHAQEVMAPYDWNYVPWFMRECVVWDADASTTPVSLRNDWVAVIRAERDRLAPRFDPPAPAPEASGGDVAVQIREHMAAIQHLLETVEFKVKPE